MWRPCPADPCCFTAPFSLLSPSFLCCCWSPLLLWPRAACVGEEDRDDAEDTEEAEDNEHVSDAEDDEKGGEAHRASATACNEGVDAHFGNCVFGCSCAPPSRVRLSFGELTQSFDTRRALLWCCRSAAPVSHSAGAAAASPEAAAAPLSAGARSVIPPAVEQKFQATLLHLSRRLFCQGCKF